jgi:2,3-bisphosphoglycerate-independent phosphoglycerate mutase
MTKTKVLCIIDGFGITKASKTNAISLAKTPHLDYISRKYKGISLNADGEHVGMEDTLVGNSEVGHMNIGGLSKVNQISFEITRSAEQLFAQPNEFASQNFDPAKLLHSNTVHVIGLISAGIIHSDMRHIIAALKLILHMGKQPVLHIIADGRDSDPFSLYRTLNALLKHFQTKQIVIGSVAGRLYTMDRNNNMERTVQAWDVITANQHATQDLTSWIQSEYTAGRNDETLTPTSFGPGIQAGEDMWFMNYRTDRMKQIIALACSWNNTQIVPGCILGLNDYGIPEYPANVHPESVGSYYALFSHHPQKFSANTYLSEQGFSQLHVAETEKFNHVTYFFNGGQHNKQSNEDWHIIPSDSLANFAQNPAMQTKAIVNYVIQSLGKYDYIVCNIAAPDMVAHSGDLEATIKAIEVVDKAIGKLLNAVLQADHTLILTADHGNAEQTGIIKIDENHNFTDTAHNPNPVPLIFVQNSYDVDLIKHRLQNIKNITQNEGDTDFIERLLNSRIKLTKKTTPVYPLWYAGWLWTSA